MFRITAPAASVLMGEVFSRSVGVVDASAEDALQRFLLVIGARLLRFSIAGSRLKAEKRLVAHTGRPREPPRVVREGAVLGSRDVADRHP